MGRVDVDKMLSEISPEQLMEWRAALDVVCIDDDWNRTAVLCQQIHSIGHAASGIESEPLPLRKYIPHAITFKPVGEEQQPTTDQSQDDMRNAAAARHGF